VAIRGRESFPDESQWFSSDPLIDPVGLAKVRWIGVSVFESFREGFVMTFVGLEVIASVMPIPFWWCFEVPQ